MQILIFIISGIVLYPIIGTIFGILLTIFKSDNEKLKISIFTFLHPLVYSILLWFIFPSIFNGKLWWLTFFFAYLIRDNVFYGGRKYFSDLTISDEHFSIKYITPLFKRKTLNVSIANVKDLKLSKMQTIGDYPASLRFCNDDDNNHKFIVLDKKTWSLANTALNLAIAKQESVMQ